MSKIINWNNEKNKILKQERNICFEDIILAIDNNNVLDIIIHPNQERYSNQNMLIVNILNYIYMVPYVENETEIFLKTIIPSRKMTRKYLQQ